MSGWKEKLFYAIEAMKGNKGNDKNTFGTKICANFKATLISCPSVSCLNLLCQFQKASQLGGLEGLENVCLFHFIRDDWEEVVWEEGATTCSYLRVEVVHLIELHLSLLLFELIEEN